MLACYERIVADAGSDGITVKEAKDIAAQAFEHAVRSGEVALPDLDLYAVGAANFDRIVRPQRQARKTALHRDMETITAALSDETILGFDDPILHVAYPLGTQDGRDKVLALWTPEDWRNAAMTRYRNAAEVTAAAQIFDDQATRIAEAMSHRGIGTTAGLFTARGAA